MALPDEIRTLRDRVLGELIAAHDYYTDTRVAWKLVRQILASGYAMSFQSPTTGTRSTPVELAERSSEYVKMELAESAFQQFLAIFESFVFDLLELWLTHYPRSLAKRMVDFQAILDLPDKEAITRLVVRKELRDVLYDRPAAWFAYLEDKAKLGCPTNAEIERLAEAKATRDVLIHNRGIANREYLSNAGRLARFHAEDRVEISQKYHREIWELLRKIVSDVCDAAILKVA